jgi:hypothetical protein
VAAENLHGALDACAVERVHGDLRQRANAVPGAVAWRRRGRHLREPADALTQPTQEPHLHEGLHSRPSILVKLRDLTSINGR